MVRLQGSRSPDFGAEIRPHSQCQKACCFFPNSTQKIPNLTPPSPYPHPPPPPTPAQKRKKKFVLHLYFRYIFTISQNNNIQSQLLLSLPLNNIHYSYLIIGINLAMETSYIRMSNFPILVKTPLIFPVPWAPAPFPKSPGLI